MPASAAKTGFQRDDTPLSAKVTSGGGGNAGGAIASGATGGAAVHMLLGLGLVLALIYVLYRVLKRTAGKREPTIRGDDWMSIIASTPLAPSRSLHLVRVGEEIVLVGSAEHGVTPLRVYSADEARELRVEPREPLALAGAPAGADGGARPGFLAALVESLRRMTAR
ncbi:MAG TPA: flagellar biosynthetic protein FliO [Gaiellales bacterium]